MTDKEKRIEDHIKDVYSVHSNPRKINLEYAIKGYELAESELASLRSELAEKEKQIKEILNFPDSKPEQVNWFIVNMLKLLDQYQRQTLTDYIAPELSHYKSLCEAADKVIDAAFPSETTEVEYWKAFNVYDQLKNTKR